MGCASYSSVNFEYQSKEEIEARKRERLRKERKAKIEEIFNIKKNEDIDKI